jgi:hypothetical protein
MADPMMELWSDTARMFKARVYEYLNRVDIPEEDRNNLEGIPRVIDDFMTATRNPTTLYTRDNLVLLVKCWNDFCTWTYGYRVCHKAFPEWSFMISQFQIFVNEFEMKEIRAKEKEHIQDMETKMTTTKSSIEDLQGRVKKLEKSWWPWSAKNKGGSGSGERMVDLLGDLEKLSCSEKREED